MSWLNTEEGKDALLELADNSDALEVILSLTDQYLARLEAELLEMNISNPDLVDRFITMRKEYDGAKKALISLRGSLIPKKERK